MATAAATPPKAPAKPAPESGGSSQQDKQEPVEKIPTPYVVLVKGGPGHQDDEGFRELYPEDTAPGETTGDLLKDDETQKGQGPRVFRAPNAKGARTDAGALIEGLKDFILTEKPTGRELMLVAVPAGSWKPTPPVVKNTEPDIQL